MANLVELFDNIVQMQNLNGVPLAAGKLYVYALGRTRLMDTWSDVDGESLNPNPIILDDAGQAHVYVSDDFDYTLVVCDQYNNEIFSLDKYLYSKGSHSHADVAVAPSESIAVSSYHVGECTVYVPYLTGQLGKVYEGIDPIVVNNQVDKISANHVPLGVQDPLYFVQDDEEGCIIGFSGGTLPEGTMNESAFGYEDGKITGYNGSGFSAGNSYEAGSYVDIDGNTINVTGLQPAGNYQSAGDYVVHDELSSYATEEWVENQSYMKEYMESAFYPSTSNPSGYLTAHQDISNKLDTTAFSTVSGDFITAIPAEYVTENTLQSGLSSKLDSTAFSTVSGNFLTAHQSLDGLMSADLLEISDNKITGYNGTAFAGTTVTGDYELSAGSGISIVDYPLEQKTVISVTAQGGNPEVEQAVIDNSATWDSVTAKLDTTAFSDVSGKYLPMTTSGLSASGTYLIDAISNNRILGINTSGISANPNGGVTSVQVGGYNSPEIKIKGYYGTMELNSAGAQYLSSDNSVVWKVGNADHLYVTNKNPDYQNIAIDISQAPRNVDTTRVMIGKNGLSACNIGSSAGMNTAYAPATVVGNSQVHVDFNNMHSVLTIGDVYVQLNGYEASSTWSLTGSIQKREIEGDTATSAITAIAGSAIGGGVPQSAFDELKQSYDALSALFAQYSGQWLLPNEGEE